MEVTKFFQERVHSHVKDFRELKWKVYIENILVSIYVYILNIFCYRWIVLCRRRITPKVNTQTNRAQYILKTKTAILKIWNITRTTPCMEYHMWKNIQVIFNIN